LRVLPASLFRFARLSGLSRIRQQPIPAASSIYALLIRGGMARVVGVGEEQRGIVRGHEGVAAHDAVAAGVEEVEEALTDIVTGHKGPFVEWMS